MSLSIKEKSKNIEKKERIILVAKDLFLKKGFASTSINLIQKETRVSKGLIYYHFKNKDDLAIAVLDNLLNQEFKDFEKLQNNLLIVKDRSQILEFLDNYLIKLFSSTMQDRSVIQIIIDLLLNLKDKASKQRVRDLYLGYIYKISKFLELLGIEEPFIHAKLIISVLDGLMYLNMALDATLNEEESKHIIRALKCLIHLEETK